MDEIKKETIWSYNFTVLTVLNFIAYLGQTSMYSLMQLHMKGLGANGTVTGTVIGIASGLAMLMRPIAGSIMDSARKKPLLLLSMLMFTLSIFGCAVAKDVAFTVVCRIVYGLGMTFCGALNMSMATEALPKSRIASGIGVFSLLAVVAGAIGPMICLKIAEASSVSAAFAFAGACNLIGFLMGLLLRYPKEARRKIKISVAGAIAKEALVPSIVMFILQLSVAGITSFLVLYADSRNIAEVTYFYGANCVLLVAVRPVLGRLSDKYGVMKIMFPSLVLFIVMLAIMPFLRSAYMLFAVSLLYALGYGTAYPSAQALCMKITPAEKRGAGTNTFYLFFDAGLFVGPTLAGILRDAVGFESMYLISIIPLAAAIVMVFLWNRKQDKSY